AESRTFCRKPASCASTTPNGEPGARRRLPPRCSIASWPMRWRAAALAPSSGRGTSRSEEHTSELQSLAYLVCRLLLEKKKCETARAFAARQRFVWAPESKRTCEAVMLSDKELKVSKFEPPVQPTTEVP